MRYVLFSFSLLLLFWAFPHLACMIRLYGHLLLIKPVAPSRPTLPPKSFFVPPSFHSGSANMDFFFHHYSYFRDSLGAAPVWLFATPLHRKMPKDTKEYIGISPYINFSFTTSTKSRYASTEFPPKVSTLFTHSLQSRATNAHDDVRSHLRRPSITSPSWAVILISLRCRNRPPQYRSSLRIRPRC